ncbi:metal ABC transporter substrate-binding protein [Micromonospora pattaloongensis]|nr:metal ABC transporter substrate-binding protein [Micromonospora pattaloongensis]
MPSRTTSRRALAAAALVALAGAGGCTGAADADPDRVSVVTAFYPLQFVTERVGGDAVRVTSLAKPGAEPHDLELNPQQVAQITDAKVIVYLKGFQPAVDEAVAQEGGDRTFDVSTATPLLTASAGGHDHEGEAGHAEESGDEHAGPDPHVWLDPTRLATIADKVAERLGAADPAHAADYTARAKALRTELETLDREYAQSLKNCQRREIVTSHSAFGYLAERYQLEQIGITGLSPEDEPSAQRLADVVTEARQHQATTIFFETLASPKVAETIAREVGAKSAVLDPIEGLQPGTTGDYLSVMRTNLTALTSALGCS